MLTDFSDLLVVVGDVGSDAIGVQQGVLEAGFLCAFEEFLVACANDKGSSSEVGIVPEGPEFSLKWEVELAWGEI